MVPFICISYWEVLSAELSAELSAVPRFLKLSTSYAGRRLIRNTQAEIRHLYQGPKVRSSIFNRPGRSANFID